MISRSDICHTSRSDILLIVGAAARARLLIGDISTGGGVSESETSLPNDGVGGRLGKLSALGLRWRTPVWDGGVAIRLAERPRNMFCERPRGLSDIAKH